MSMITIKRFGVLSSAKIYGALMAIMGLIIGVIYGLFLMLFGAAMMSMSRGGSSALGAGASSIVAALAMMVMFPVFYGVIGLIAGALGSVIYNLLAKLIGGLEIEIESENQMYTPPPQPNVAGYYQSEPQQYQPR